MRTETRNTILCIGFTIALAQALLWFADASWADVFAVWKDIANVTIERLA